jgi:ribosomal protein S18 acetylase RimI-like enzyme
LELGRIIVREAKPSDVPGIIACLSAAFEPYKTIYTTDGYRDTVPTIEGGIRRLGNMAVFVAEDDSSRIVGTVACRVVGSGEGHLRGMAVIPEFQGRGIAERLLLAAETELRKLGCSRVSLDTTQPLKRATSFYIRHGYRPSGNVKDYFGMPLFEYEKTLDNKTV